MPEGVGLLIQWTLSACPRKQRTEINIYTDVLVKYENRFLGNVLMPAFALQFLAMKLLVRLLCSLYQKL